MASDESLDDIKNEIMQAISEGRTQRDKISDTVNSVQAEVEKVTSFIDKIKDNIAWLLGLPATIGGAFGFLWDSGNNQSSLEYQVAQLESAVADLKSEGDLLGGGTKNFSLDLSGAPGGSLTPILIGAGILIILGLLFWYQSRRK